MGKRRSSSFDKRYLPATIAGVISILSLIGLAIMRLTEVEIRLSGVFSFGIPVIDFILSGFWVSFLALKHGELKAVFFDRAKHRFIREYWYVTKYPMFVGFVGGAHIVLTYLLFKL